MTGEELLDHLKILPKDYLKLEVFMETGPDPRRRSFKPLHKLNHVEVHSEDDVPLILVLTID